MSTLQDILIENINSNILLIKLNRPEVRNALRNKMLNEIANTLIAAESNNSIKVVVITGSDKFFAAGADIDEMANTDAINALLDKRPQYWRTIANFTKPILVAVNGFALGAGCELVMHADIVIAGNDSKFGQPEINLGTIPGAGGTQRLIRTVGKPLAMKMVLGGEFINAEIALSSGLISEITKNEETLKRALSLAETIARKSPLALRVAKEMLLKSFETGLDTALNMERKAFSLLAASDDRREGINAFKEKRTANFTGS